MPDKKEKEELMTQVKEELKKKEARKISIKEASFSSVSQGAGKNYISAFAIALGASNAQIGILASLPRIITPLSQLAGVKLIEKKPRKKVVTRYVFLEAIMWIPILILGLLAYNNILIKNLPLTLIILYSVLVLISALSVPSWFSWMGDIVPEKIRGKYFSKKKRITSTTILISMFIASFFLDYFKTKGLVLIGFSILFLISCIARIIATYLFTKQHEPKIELEEGYYFSLFSFIKNLYKNNFGKFTLYVGLLWFAAFIASPFFAVYMLRNLQFSYFWFTAITMSTAIFALIFLNFLGKLSDKYGNKILLKIGSILIPLVPILWLFSGNPVYLLIAHGLVGGLGWAAFNLGSNNFIYDSVTPQRRAICIAYYNVIIGVGVILGGVIGGLLAQYITIKFMNNILFIFLVSGVLRSLAGITMIPRIKEVRKRRKIQKRLSKKIVSEIKPANIEEAVDSPPSLKELFFSRFKSKEQE